MSPLRVVAAAVAFILYLIAAAFLWMRSVPAALGAILIVGGYLAIGLGYYRHELYHNYYRPFTRQLYLLTSLLVFSDGRLFRIAHPTHHGAVHTYDDLEFFCAGYATNPWARKRQFIVELLFGNAAWEFRTMERLKDEGRITEAEYWRSLAIRLASLLCLASCSAWVVPGSFGPFILVYALTLWWGAVISRHNQFIEHLGIVGEGTLEERNLMTRNLPDATLLDWLWNLYNRNDPREHVLHHIRAGVNSRLLPEPLPEGARTVSIWEYPALLREHWLYLDESLREPRAEAAEPGEGEELPDGSR